MQNGWTSTKLKSLQSIFGEGYFTRKMGLIRNEDAFYECTSCSPKRICNILIEKRPFYECNYILAYIIHKMITDGLKDPGVHLADRERSWLTIMNNLEKKVK